MNEWEGSGKAGAREVSKGGIKEEMERVPLFPFLDGETGRIR